MIIKCPHAKPLETQEYIEYGYSYIKCPNCGYTGDVGSDPHKNFYKMKIKDEDSDLTWEEIYCPMCSHHALYFPYEEIKGHYPCTGEDVYYPLSENPNDKHPIRRQIRDSGLKVKDKKYGYDAKEDEEEKVTNRNLISCPMFGNIREGADLCSKCQAPKMSPEVFKKALEQWKKEQEENEKLKKSLQDLNW